MEKEMVRDLNHGPFFMLSSLRGGKTKQSYNSNQR